MAGAVTGLCFGFFSTLLLFHLTWQSWIQTASEVASQANGLYSAFNVQTVMYTLVALAALFDVFPGMLVGLFFVKLVNPFDSTYIKAVIFGGCLWLLPSTVAFVFLPSYPTSLSTVIVFVILLLILFVFDSILFACLFTQWSKPPVVKPVQAGLPSFLTLHRIGMLGSATIVCVMCVMVWRMIELVPSLESSSSSQLIFLVSIAVLLFFAYALVQIKRFLRNNST